MHVLVFILTVLGFPSPCFDSWSIRINSKFHLSLKARQHRLYNAFASVLAVTLRLWTYCHRLRKMPRIFVKELCTFVKAASIFVKELCTFVKAATMFTKELCTFVNAGTMFAKRVNHIWHESLLSSFDEKPWVCFRKVVSYKCFVLSPTHLTSFPFYITLKIISSRLSHTQFGQRQRTIWV